MSYLQDSEFPFDDVVDSSQENSHFLEAKQRIDAILGELSTDSDDLDKDIQNAKEMGVVLPNPRHEDCTYVRVAGRILRERGAYYHVLTYDEVKEYLHQLSRDELEDVKRARYGRFPLPFRD